jgi:RNA polymerase primary sigma factor
MKKPAARSRVGAPRRKVKAVGRRARAEADLGLPSEGQTTDSVAEASSLLGDEELQLVDAATQVRMLPARLAGGDAEAAQAVVHLAREDASVSLEAQDSSDPIRLYLRRVGRVPLLTREGEVEIAKRMEEGEQRVADAIIGSELAVREVIALGESLRTRKIRVTEIIREAAESPEGFDEGLVSRICG